MENRNFLNVNDVFPVLDLIRRELAREGLYTGGDDLTLLGGNKPEPNVINIEALREMTGYPTLVTKVIYTYDNGTIEKLTLERDSSMVVVGFLIEIEHKPLVNEQMEEETDITSFSAIHGTIIRENGLFKNLVLEYSKAV
ncbi:hypothetical protein SECTIM467_39 [Brevibacillus phage SecTim467]|uniref:Uncharacterized protein n=2 Tax=Jenstvirus jenst TaxID=1982225 RepID=A0A0K2CP80_9CAUD|nr:hypothetical protein AVV11_gp152 [Brevibacillus phage Jenst]ALA07169.1 hypothetical protein JENST_39 [Brevibacillus phage Jenst]ALA07538.1 hypothetical protein SECTIM467_39 [Brevibacillus phage SecTim467]